MINFITLSAPDERVRELIEIYSEYEEQIKPLLRSSNLDDNDEARMLFKTFLQEQNVVNIFPGIITLYDNIEEIAIQAETITAKTVGRASAFNDVINFLNILSAGSEDTDALNIVTVKAARDPLYNSIVTKIQEIAEEDSIIVNEYNSIKLIGPVATVSENGFVIETLVNREIIKGDKVVVKRKNRYGEEIVIATAIVTYIVSSRIGAKLETILQEEYSPDVGDMVYLID